MYQEFTAAPHPTCRLFLAGNNSTMKISQNVTVSYIDYQRQISALDFLRHIDFLLLDTCQNQDLPL